MRSEDAGLAAVAAVRRALEPEPAESRDEPRGFTWQPGAHAMRVSAAGARPDGTCIVATESVLLAGVPGRGATFAALAGRNAREPGLSALRWNAESGEVSLRAAVHAHPNDAGAAARRLGHAALLQVASAPRAADALAIELPEAVIPAGSRAAGDTAYADAEHAYAVTAAPLAEAMIAAVADLAGLASAPWTRVSRAAHGLDAEIACVPSAASTPAEPRALLRVSGNQPHPRLGPGLVFALALPPDPGRAVEQAAATAALLNEAESREWTGVEQLGGWCVHPGSGLTHVLFVPALAVEADTAAWLAGQAAARARWASAFLRRAARRAS